MNTQYKSAMEFVAARSTRPSMIESNSANVMVCRVLKARRLRHSPTQVGHMLYRLARIRMHLEQIVPLLPLQLQNRSIHRAFALS